MATVKVFDLRGRLLLEKKNINATETTVGGGMANEVLLIQITTVQGVVVTKRVIRLSIIASFFNCHWMRVVC
jgi:hypothetical protein